MITLYDFRGMDDNQQAEATFNGEFMGDRQEEGHHVQLYRVDEFYVEVFYDPAANKITRMRAFANPELLVPYIDISDLLKR
jgi:hypothetical protein